MPRTVQLSGETHWCCRTATFFTMSDARRWVCQSGNGSVLLSVVADCADMSLSVVIDVTELAGMLRRPGKGGGCAATGLIAPL